MLKRALGAAGIAAALSALFAAQATAQDAVAPEYQWAKGDTLRYRMSIQRASKVTGAQQMEITQHWGYVWRQEVKDVAADGTATLEEKFESASVHLQIPARNLDFSYDPANPDDAKRASSPIAIPFVAIAGEAVTYKVNKKGKVLEATGVPEMTQRILDKVKADPKGAGYVPLAIGALGDLQLSQMEGLFHRLPEKPVKSGETYKPPKTRQPDPALGSILIDTSCTYEGPEPAGGADGYKFKCSMDKTVEAPAAGQSAPPPKAKLTDDETTSEFVLGKTKGIITKSTGRSRMTVETSLPADPNAAPGTAPGTITQSDDMTASLEAIPAEAPPAAPAAAPTTPPPAPTPGGAQPK